MTQTIGKHFALATVLLMLHSVGVGCIWLVSATEPSGCFSGTEWLPVAVADIPVAMLFQMTEASFSANQTALVFLLGGGVQWFLLGMMLQSLWRWIMERVS